jgi:predicted DNA-binding antitoxin AbrB/MazE fold protein
MSETITAIYEHGVLRPLTPLALPENARVQIQIMDQPASNEERTRVLQVLVEAGIISAAEPPSPFPPISESELERLGEELAKEGPLSDTIIEERGK